MQPFLRSANRKWACNRLPLNYTLTLLAELFRYFIDDSIFRLRLLSAFARCTDFTEPLTRSPARQSVPYLHSYLMYQALREQPTPTSRLGRIRLAARAIDGPDSELTYLSSLVCLAITANVYPLLWKPTIKPDDSDGCDNANTEADFFVAAAYLGRKDHIAHLIAKGVPYCRNPDGLSFDSQVFGSALSAASMQGNLEMIKLLLLCTPQYCNAGTLPVLVAHRMLIVNSAYSDRANTCNQQAVFNFVLDTILVEWFKSGDEAMHSRPLAIVLGCASCPNDFERAALLLPPFYHDRAMDVKGQLMMNVQDGKVEMVRYLLNKGVSPNIEDLYSTPIIRAIKGGNDTILRMLLDSNADPTYKTLDRNNALMTAVWKGRVAVANILLDRGVDPNEGYPPPIVLAVFKEHLNMFRLLRDHGARLDTPETGGLAMMVAGVHGLSSMQDVLVHEGVRRDVILDDDPAWASQHWAYNSLWLI
ncbi:ankyrin [Ustulina deusta]|nr:ankyrin [Ustulina deusta]